MKERSNGVSEILAKVEVTSVTDTKKDEEKPSLYTNAVVDNEKEASNHTGSIKNANKEVENDESKGQDKQYDATSATVVPQDAQEPENTSENPDDRQDERKMKCKSKGNDDEMSSRRRSEEEDDGKNAVTNSDDGGGDSNRLHQIPPGAKLSSLSVDNNNGCIDNIGNILHDDDDDDDELEIQSPPAAISPDSSCYDNSSNDSNNTDEDNSDTYDADQPTIKFIANYYIEDISKVMNISDDMTDGSNSCNKSASMNLSINSELQRLDDAEASITRELQGITIQDADCNSITKMFRSLDNELLFHDALKFILVALKKELGITKEEDNENHDDQVNNKSGTTYTNDDTNLLKFVYWKPDVLRALERYKKHEEWRRKYPYVFDDDANPLLVSFDDKLFHEVIVAPEGMVDKKGSSVLIIRLNKLCDFINKISTTTTSTTTTTTTIKSSSSSPPPSSGNNDNSDADLDKLLYRTVIFTLDRMLERIETQYHGMIVIIDFKGIRRKDINLDIPKLFTSLIGNFPIRVNGIYMLRSPWWLPGIAGNVKNLYFPYKLRRRIHYINDIGKLKVIIDEDYLLEEYGGNLIYDPSEWLSYQIKREKNGTYGSLKKLLICSTCEDDDESNDLVVT